MNNMLTLKPLTAGHDVGKEHSFSERQTGLWPCPAGISSMLSQHTWPISWACALCPPPCSVPPVWSRELPFPNHWLFCLTASLAPQCEEFFCVCSVARSAKLGMTAWYTSMFGILCPSTHEGKNLKKKIIWAHAPSLNFIPMALVGQYFMAHLIKQLSLMSSKNIHIKPVIRAWNPVGVTIYTTKESEVTSETWQLCGMNRKKAK